MKMNNIITTITIITKLKTPNAGNQAVSTELLRLLQRDYPDARIFAGWRVPGLEQYSFTRLQHSGTDPLHTLDNWADSILNAYNSSKKTKYPRQENLVHTGQWLEISPNKEDPAYSVELASVTVPSLPMRLCRKSLRILKSPFDRLRIYGTSYEPWLKVMENSNLVLYSPAGLLTDSDYLVRDLLSLRIAQKLGARVSAINQSIEVKNPVLLCLLGQLYNSLDAVIVRDPLSLEILRKLGISQERVELAPDTAYLAQPTPMDEYRQNETVKDENIKLGTVGINTYYRKGVDFIGWGKIIKMLRAMGKEIIFVSNQMSDDRLVGKELQKLYGVKIISRQYDYNEYIRVLSSLELVISERYHTCVFSAIAGTPFIPLKYSALSKMHGVVWFLNYSIPPIDLDSAGWAEIVQKHIKDIYGQYDHIKAGLNEVLPRMRKLAELNAQ
jgi:polysaccharide pyruvyl transferase WcaK-like protein